MDRTGWHRPFEDGMLGQHPKFKEQQYLKHRTYYSKEELDGFREHLKDQNLKLSRCTIGCMACPAIIRLKTNGTVVLWILMF